MPEIVVSNYKLSGWKGVVMFSEMEMSEILAISRKDLRKAIEAGKLSYSVHPKANHFGEYEFSEAIVKYNIELWACLSSGGHYFEFVSYYDEAQTKRRHKCKNCPAEKYD